MTEPDKDTQIAELKDFIQRLQWEVRNAYYLGFTAADPERGQSNINPQKGKWFDHWLLSKPRQMLVGWGVISEKDDYR